MKEATGELNMTVVTIIAIGAIIAFFWVMWPNITNTINGMWKSIGGETSTTNGQQCPAGQYPDGRGGCTSS